MSHVEQRDFADSDSLTDSLPRSWA